MMTGINLLPGRELKDESDRKAMIRYLCFFSSIMLLVWVLIDSSIHKKTTFYLNRNKRMSHQINCINRKINGILIGNKDNNLPEKNKYQTSPFSILKWITHILPYGVVLSKIERQGDVVSLFCYSKSDHNVRDLIKGLMKSDCAMINKTPDFTKTKPTLTDADQSFKITFTIQSGPVCLK